MAAAAIRVQALPGQMQRLIEAIGLAATEQPRTARVDYSTQETTWR